MKNNDNTALLARKQRIDAERRARATDRATQYRLRARWMIQQVAKGSGVA